MKTASKDLFDLIKALSKNEKNDFKKYAKETIHKEKNYLDLFNAIDKAKEYDEKELILKLGYVKKIKAFAVLKNYLYQELIKTVTKITHHNDHTHDTIDHLQQLNFLANKSLYVQYAKLWEKTYKEAKEKELFQLQFMLRSQMHTLKINFYIKTSQKEIQETIKEEEAFTEQYENLQKIRNLYRKIQLFNRQTHIRFLESEIKELQQFLKHPLLKKELPNASFHYAYYYNFSIGLIYYLTHDYKKAFTYFTKIKQDILQNVALLEANFDLNIDFISHFYLISFLQKEYNSFFEYLNQSFNQKTKSKQYKSLIFAYWANSHIRYFITTGQYDKAKLHLAKTEKQIDEHLDFIPIEIKQILLTSLSISNFIIGNYNEAYYRSKVSIHTFQLYPRLDIQRTIYCLNILIAFELKNKRLLYNECDITYQFFYRKKISSPFEEIFISFFKKLAKSNDGRMALKEKFADFRNQLEPIKKDPILAQVFRYFNFYGWVESKEQGINYMTYVQNQSKT